MLPCVHQCRSFVCWRKMDHRRKAWMNERGGGGYKGRKQFETVAVADRRGRMGEKAKLHPVSGCTGGTEDGTGTHRRSQLSSCVDSNSLPVRPCTYKSTQSSCIPVLLWAFVLVFTCVSGERGGTRRLSPCRVWSSWDKVCKFIAV